jgi:methionyl-tRNA synthetase
MKRLKSYLDQTANAYHWRSFSPQRATRLACDLVKAARDFGLAQEAWRRTPAASNEQRTGIALELCAARTLAMMVAPIMPDFAAAVRKALGEEGEPRWEEEPHFVKPGTTARGLDAEFFPAPVIESKVAAAV